MIKWTPVENIIRQMVIVTPHSGIENADSISFDEETYPTFLDEQMSLGEFMEITEQSEDMEVKM